MKTLIINGSPRVNGDTNSLINIVKERIGEFWEIKALSAGEEGPQRKVIANTWSD